MAPLVLELTQLEVETLDIVDCTTEQQKSLDTLTTMQRDVVAILTQNGTPINGDDDGGGSISVPCCLCHGCCCCQF